MEEIGEVSIPIANNVWEGDGQVFSKLATLEKLVDDAERRSLKEKAEANIWLEELIDMQDEVEDWWDNYRIYFHKPKINLHHHDLDLDLDLDEEEDEDAKKRMSKLIKKVRSFIPSLCSRLKNNFPLVKSGDDFASKTKALSEKLDTFLKDAIRSNFFASRSLESLPASASASASASTFSLIDKSLMVLGTRDENLERLLPFLFHPLENSSSSNSNRKNWIKMVAIVGKAGIGKTRLAQVLYDNDEVEYFEVRRWVRISHDFDEERIANALLGDGGIRDSGLRSGSLFQIIKDYFSGKKFLLVMDDAWDWSSSIWELFRDSLEHGAPGSIILVTTRIPEMAYEMRPDAIFRPSLLSEAESWSLLKQTSLSGRSHVFSETVKEIGQNIIEKCGGLPFNIKIIGSHLQFKDTVQEWEQVADSRFWRMPRDSFRFASLSISYNDLPLQLQRCFLYLAAFPFGADINVEKLIRLWMAQGYLGPSFPSHDDKRMEMKGTEYFKTLAMRSFFHNLAKSSVHKDTIISFQIPTIVHDFAKFQCYTETSASSVLGNGIDVRVPPRTFLNIAFQPQVSKDLWFTEMKHCIRALDLSSCQLGQLSREVGNMILLQYLNLSNNPLKQLPETICDLYYLQFLDLHFCYMLSHIPQRIGDLQQLRHLRINHTTDELQQMLQGLEKLTSIRTLDVFRVGGRYNSLAMLEKLNDLEEISIAIHGRKGLEDPKLERKTQMRNLEVSFVGEGHDVEIVRIINRFEPPPNLEMLKFEGYPGFQPPKWLEAESAISNLKRLSIRSALNLMSLPAALWKLSSLESLWLYDIPNLKRLGHEFLEASFSSLVTLRIEYLENLETWEDIDEEDYMRTTPGDPVMPCLEELIINSCPKLKLEALPHCILGRLPSVNIKVNGEPYHTQ